MTMLPSDLTSHVGQDASLGDIFGAAWRGLRAHFWPALGYGLLAVVIVIGILLVTCCTGGIVAMPIALIGVASGTTAGAFAGHMVSKTFSYLIGATIGGFIIFPLLAGYLWSLVCTFDARPMEAGDLFAGFRYRYRPLWRLGISKGLIETIIYIAYLAASFSTSFTVARGGGLPFTSIRDATAALGIFGVWILALWIVNLFFMLTPYFAFAHQSPTWTLCLADNWRVLKSRPREFLLVFFFPLLAMLAVAIAATLLIAPTAALFFVPGTAVKVLAVLLLIAEGLAGFAASACLYLYACFLYAAFFRASYGYTLELPHPAATAGSDAP